MNLKKLRYKTRKISAVVSGRRGFALAGLVWACLILVLFYRPSAFMSPEVAFTDTAPSGLAIVPASCASGVPATSGDVNGVAYKIPNGTSHAEIVNPAGKSGTLSGVTDYFCVTNNGGPLYFLPAKTHAELQAFIGAAGGLSGISIQNPGPDNP